MSDGYPDSLVGDMGELKVHLHSRFLNLFIWHGQNDIYRSKSASYL